MELESIARHKGLAATSPKSCWERFNRMSHNLESNLARGRGKCTKRLTTISSLGRLSEKKSYGTVHEKRQQSGSFLEQAEDYSCSGRDSGLFSLISREAVLAGRKADSAGSWSKCDNEVSWYKVGWVRWDWWVSFDQRTFIPMKIGTGVNTGRT